MSEGKNCSRCGEWKSYSEFTKHNSSKDGYRWQCRQCNQIYQQDKDKRQEWSSRYYRKRKETDPAMFMWKQAKHRAQFDYGGMEFTIEPSDVVLPDRCPYMDVCFIPLDPRYGYSLDRIDSSKGYTPDNIQVISRVANIMKNNATEDELIKFAEGVLRRHSKEG